MVQILELIRDDHDFIRNLFDELESNPDTRDIRCITLRRELPGHMDAEEATLYARLRGAKPEVVRRLMADHTAIRETLARFEVSPLRDDAWLPALAGLREEIEAHFTLEEEDIFEQARRHIDINTLFELGEVFPREKVAAARSMMM